MAVGKILAAAGVLALCAAAHAGEVPKWELGAGAAVLSYPAYRGSDARHVFAIPLPYLIYRGDILKADREGIRGQLFGNDRLNLSLSLYASPPSSSDKAEIRSGMPDLKPVVEFGPQLEWNLWRSEARVLKLRLPVRAAFTVERSSRQIGTLFSPNLNLNIRDLPGLEGWNVGLVAGPIYASREQHAYYYSVAPQYARPGRPAYEARGGYSGTQLLLTMTRRFDRLWLGAFVRYDNLRGAVFEDSPLFAKRGFLAGGVSLAWVFAQSEAMVDARD